jgi:hypothetical protein
MGDKKGPPPTQEAIDYFNAFPVYEGRCQGAYDRGRQAGIAEERVRVVANAPAQQQQQPDDGRVPDLHGCRRRSGEAVSDKKQRRVSVMEYRRYLFRCMATTLHEDLHGVGAEYLFDHPDAGMGAEVWVDAANEANMRSAVEQVIHKLERMGDGRRRTSVRR